jgi:uncharacterized protein (DUF2267 family)
MKVFEGTDLPDDFVIQVKRHAKAHYPDRFNAIEDAVFDVLGRLLTAQEKLAIVDAAHAGRLKESVRIIESEASAAGSKWS